MRAQRTFPWVKHCEGSVMLLTKSWSFKWLLIHPSKTWAIGVASAVRRLRVFCGKSGKVWIAFVSTKVCSSKLGSSVSRSCLTFGIKQSLTIDKSLVFQLSFYLMWNNWLTVEIRVSRHRIERVPSMIPMKILGSCLGQQAIDTLTLCKHSKWTVAWIREQFDCVSSVHSRKESTCTSTSTRPEGF